MNDEDKIKTIEILLNQSVEAALKYNEKKLRPYNADSLNQKYIQRNIKLIYLGYVHCQKITQEKVIDPIYFIKLVSAVIYVMHGIYRMTSEIEEVLDKDIKRSEGSNIECRIIDVKNALKDMEKSYKHEVSINNLIKVVINAANQILDKEEEESISDQLKRIYEVLEQNDYKILHKLNNPFRMGVYMNKTIKFQNKEIIITMRRLEKEAMEIIKLEEYLEAMSRYLLTGEEISEENFFFEGTNLYGKMTLADINIAQLGRQDFYNNMQTFNDANQRNWMPIVYKNNQLLKIKEYIDRKYKDMQDSVDQCNRIFRTGAKIIYIDKRLH